MELVSSDSNVWIDFEVIDRLDLPFCLPHKYVMCKDAFLQELFPFSDKMAGLCGKGLHLVDLTDTELQLVLSWEQKYRKLSRFDRCALAIALERNCVLLTGDRALRNAAGCEGVSCMGTLGIFGLLFELDILDCGDFLESLRLLQTHNGQEIRLPANEIDDTIKLLEAFV